jgi:hypothetical protein
MSWLKKIVSSIGARGVKQVAEQVMEAMPTATCLTAEPDAAAAVSDSAQEDESPIKQRRYFVKKGLYVDNEEERAAAKAAKAAAVADEIPDKQPVDLKSLFPKLSLR